MVERLLWWLADKSERAAFRLREKRRGNTHPAARMSRTNFPCDSLAYAQGCDCPRCKTFAQTRGHV